jgi:energy-coupling factor transporter ATP-binding protein EcfA2
MSLLKVVNLRLKPGKKAVSFEVIKGTRLCIMGKNSSGKFELLQSLTQEHPKINSNSPKLACTLSDIKPANEERSIKNYLQEITGDDSGIDQIVKYAELNLDSDQQLSSLSFQQLVQLRLSVIATVENGIIILDELLDWCDEDFRDKLLKTLKMRNQGGLIFLSNNLHYAKQLATEVLVLDDHKPLAYTGELNSGFAVYREQVLNLPIPGKFMKDPSGIEIPDRRFQDLPSPKYTLPQSLKLVSIHIPKTAGTSFQRILEDVYGIDKILRIDLFNRKKPDIKFQGKQITPADIPEGVEVIHGHFNYHELLEWFQLDPSLPIITWLREPVNRLFSHYSYFMRVFRYDIDIIPDHLVRSFLEYGSIPQNRNLQSRYLKGITFSALSFVGTVENMSGDLKRLQKILDWPDFKEHYVNTSGNKKTRIRNDVRDQLLKLNKVDMDLYTKALKSH